MLVMADRWTSMGDRRARAKGWELQLDEYGAVVRLEAIASRRVYKATIKTELPLMTLPEKWEAPMTINIAKVQTLVESWAREILEDMASQ